jgi:hypothetical protein
LSTRIRQQTRGLHREPTPLHLHCGGSLNGEEASNRTEKESSASMVRQIQASSLRVVKELPNDLGKVSPFSRFGGCTNKDEPSLGNDCLNIWSPFGSDYHFLVQIYISSCVPSGCGFGGFQKVALVLGSRERDEHRVFKPRNDTGTQCLQQCYNSLTWKVV